jgi:sn-glycerol 3-phosphate transport system permease protein
MLIPDEMKLVPNYLLVSGLGWRDTLWALTVPPAASAFPVFVFYQHFRMLPPDLAEAARVDGASHFRVLFQLLVPVSRPVIYAVTLVAFLGRWNDFLWPLVVTDRVSMRTLPVGLAYLRDVETNTANWHLLMAGAVFVIMPVVLLFIITQRRFITGVIQGAVKG